MERAAKRRTGRRGCGNQPGACLHKFEPPATACQIFKSETGTAKQRRTIPKQRPKSRTRPSLPLTEFSNRTHMGSRQVFATAAKGAVRFNTSFSAAARGA